ncbi:MAG: hypothetical protein LBB74_04875, partial [Chitinispirillales bacterium]|nr:hypothetical protein [Chitinispirillales bacterium]
MGKTNRNYRTILSASALCLASVWLPLTWCAKKTGQEAAPETSDTLSAIADTLPETPVPFTDTRDGRKYRVVKIGNQRWMAQNLNYQTADSSWCYGNDNSNCDTYGRLYAWSAAKTACPAGWHLPSRAEWDILSNFVNKGGARQVNWTS